jgi:GxxExxY protein
MSIRPLEMILGKRENKMDATMSRAQGSGLIEGELTGRILACAIDVHRELGPGMLERTYRICLLHRLRMEGLTVRQEQPIAIEFKGQLIENAYRADLIVADTVLVELKAVEALLPVHEAQVLTYLKFLNLPVGLLLNFNVTSLKQGIRRFVC